MEFFTVPTQRLLKEDVCYHGEYNLWANTPQSILIDMQFSFIPRFNNDVEYKEKISKYMSIIDIAETCNEYWSIAECILDEFQDENWARTMYRKAEDNIEDIEDYCLLAGSIIGYIKDENWAEKLLSEAIAFTNNNPNVINYEYIAELFIRDMKNVNKGRELLEIAEKHATSYEDFKWLTFSILNNLQDEIWAAKVYELALENIKTKDEYDDFYISNQKLFKTIESTSKMIKQASLMQGVLMKSLPISSIATI